MTLNNTLKNTFIFAVITYNHSAYILEHLESIKFLIHKYGADFNFKLVIADDGSKDKTVELIHFWLNQNTDLFFDFIFLSDGINRGTCVNYTNLWQYIDSPYFKITAGDDVYSCLNIFEEAFKLDSNDFISGIPLILTDQKITKSNSTIFHMLATDIIYKKSQFIDRLRKISVINTPSLFYNLKFLKNTQLYDFIRTFKVTEDFPMVVKIAGLYSDVKFMQSPKVLIYYRRTSGSTYLIRGSDFDRDKLQIFNYMLSTEKGWFNKIAIQSRIQCYLSNNKVYKIVYNLNYWIYLKDIALCFPVIIWTFFKINVNIDIHQNHYNELKIKSDRLLKEFNKPC